MVLEWPVVVKRAAVWPSTALGAYWAAWHELRVLRRLPRCAFAPPPSVDAGVLGLQRRDVPLVPVNDARAYRRFLARCFASRPRDAVATRTVKRLASELGFDASGAARDLDARQLAALFGCRPSDAVASARQPNTFNWVQRGPERSPDAPQRPPQADDTACALTAAPVAAEARELLDAEAMARTLSRIAHEIIERNPELDRLALVGIHTRGVPLAQRLRRLVEERVGRCASTSAPSTSPSTATTSASAAARRRSTRSRSSARPQLDFPLEGRTVVLVDDVLYTGRTIRAAIEALFDYGRPERIQLAVLVDRGHRELPIRPDYVGKNLPTARDERVQVQLVEVDEVDRVLLVPPPRRNNAMADIRVMREQLPPAAPPRRHLISIRDLTRDDVERLLATARSFEASLEREVKKLPTLRGRAGHQRLLRVVDAHVVELRARCEAPLGRHDVDQGRPAPRSTRASR